MLAKAIAFATEQHASQTRKYTPVPFITHPLRVMHYVIQDPVYGGDDEAAAIAVLHDVVEDCSVDETDEGRLSLALEIGRQFGLDVELGAVALTDEYTKARYPGLNRAQRKAAELERLENTSDRNRTIKLYDRLCNLEDMIREVEADRGFARLYAQESWELALALSTVENQYVSNRVFELAAELRDLTKRET